jgi:hypothetical protein
MAGFVVYSISCLVVSPVREVQTKLRKHPLLILDTVCNVTYLRSCENSK